MIEISEIVYRWQQGLTKQAIANSLGISRNTVKKEIRKAQEHGLTIQSHQDAIDAYFAEKANGKSSGKGKQTTALDQHHKQIVEWLSMPHMTMRQIQRLLVEQGHNFPYSTLQRYIHHQTDFLPKKSSTVHLETLPGEQGQVDFAYVGLLFDLVTKRMRKAHIFIMTLSHSRHRFVRFVFRQDIPNWVDCHIRAFEFFQGVPHCVLLDNLKSGVLKPDIYDPTINPAYAECERHYGFVADPAKVRTPKHKGKVERSVTIVRQQLLAGRHYCHINEANAAALIWCREKIAHVVTTTTGETPMQRFLRDDHPALLPLPSTAFECPIWQTGKVHFDHHIVFQGSFYSVPTAYMGQIVSIKATLKLVQIYSSHQLIKTHVRATDKGQWVTDVADYPKKALQFLDMDASTCRANAYEIGASAGTLVCRLLTQPSLTQQRKCQAILRLATLYPPLDVEAVCHEMVLLETVTYKAVRERLDQRVSAAKKAQSMTVLPKESGYVRDSAAFCPQ